ncbi:hypothetical protein CFP65_6339 [Kitasatospora sp. MMS16-BH015]|nr:hypothetical protein CFP65_6339 [Kitasatospora sp. MMS16-BH015]
MWRYRELMGHAFVLPRARRRVFQWGLRRCARRARVADLVELLDYGWRERLVAGWLIAAGGRNELRPRLAQELSDPEPQAQLDSYCVALACLGTEQDARILRDHLVKSLALAVEGREEHRRCRAAAMGALLYLDQRLGTDYSGPLLTEGGPWARWPGSSGTSVEEEKQEIATAVAFACGADPAPRSQKNQPGVSS